VFTLVIAACAPSASSSPITGTVWQWTAMQETVPAHQSMVPDPENFTITFNSDGTIDVKADCNMGGGTYTVEGSSLTISVGSMTMAYCGDDSSDQIYLQSLANVSSYALEGSDLQLIFADNGGKMDFQSGGSAQ
jgi:heat shock protein HslJ